VGENNEGFNQMTQKNSPDHPTPLQKPKTTKMRMMNEKRTWHDKGKIQT